MPTLGTKARSICRSSMKGTLHRDGKPAHEHSERLALRVAGLADGSEELISIAWLHDVLEDTNWTERDLRPMFTKRIVDAVVALTRGKEETWRSYLGRVIQNKDAVRIKIFDIEDNMRRMDAKMAAKKRMYAEALALLRKAISEQFDRT